MNKSIALLLIVVLVIAVYGALNYFGMFGTLVSRPGTAPIKTEAGVASYKVGIFRGLPDSAGAGEPITVNLDVKLGGAKYYIIDEQVPDGWAVLEASNGGSSLNTGHVKWIVLANAKDTTLIYTVRVPDTAKGVYNFNGSYALEKGTTAAIAGDGGVTIK